MLAARLPDLNWSAWLYCDVGPAETMARHDGGPFAEEADMGAEIDVIGPGGLNGSIVRYHYRENAGCLHAWSDKQVTAASRHQLLGRPCEALAAYWARTR
jgi:hypothetical protein